MKAWKIEKHGGPEALKSVELPVPEPGPMETRIRVEAVGLNHLDLWARKGIPGFSFPLPLTPGCDIAGKIDRFGPGAEAALAPDGLKAGSDVLVNPGLSCGHCPACLGGFDPLCRRYGIIGETRDGGLAEYVCVPIANVIPRPAGLGAEQAAALPIAYLTAWTMLMSKARLLPAETILIQAGGSGVSVAAIQMAKLIGATVVTTVGSDEKAAAARALGADHVINYRKSSVAKEWKNRCEVVIDHVGADTFPDSLKCLTWGGRLACCGATSGAKIELDLKALFFKNISLLGSTMGSKADLIRIVNLVAQGKLKPVIDSTFAISELPRALERLENRQAFGKVIVCSS